MATRKKKEVIEKEKTVDIWPKIEKGSHLTVKTFEDGSAELEWDHEALDRDVLNALYNKGK